MNSDTSSADRQLDVREIDGEPFGDIMTAIEDLPAGESLLLINSFEPAPLYNVLDDRGFAYESDNPDPDVWHVHISHAESGR